ncbi:serine hydrolase [Cohnella sp. REN36]|uniref:serine hydrolase domain-containing protein n=1 Tax=Cohnella sp. REN36 TaxID=2887347 RepID=UPI001D1503D1|nr:serine hydrolase domain-containing protein [Cohnella sp. REN36]MCC3373544.1 beta-lactamase family protein [Cohnella sp. REN36]
MDFQPLARLIDRITAWRIPWAEVMVILRNETVFHYRNGYADLERRTPIAERQIVHLYSLTKLMTCTAALQLVERGAMLLGDPLADYLPEYVEMNVRKTLPDGRQAVEKAERPITVRDLFTMTAGFSYDLEAPAIREMARSTNGRAPTRSFAAALAKEPLLFEPGTRWSYGFGHDVLAALIEAVDGRRFGIYVRDEITEPLGMSDTGFDLTDEQQGRLAPQYAYHDEAGRAVRKDGNSFRLGSQFESGGAGLLSTVSDYALFLNALTNLGTAPSGVRILSPAMVELMRTDHLTARMREDFHAFPWVPFVGYGYGLGVRTHLSPSQSGLLSSIGEFGWSGAAGCLAVCDPASRLTVMYAQQLLNNQESYVHPRLKNTVYSCLSNDAEG